MKTAEQRARELLRKMDVPGALDMTTGDVVELANLYARVDDLERSLGQAIKHLEWLGLEKHETTSLILASCRATLTAKA